jgi:hypothetical protein
VYKLNVNPTNPTEWRTYSEIETVTSRSRLEPIENLTIDPEATRPIEKGFSPLKAQIRRAMKQLIYFFLFCFQA